MLREVYTRCKLLRLTKQLVHREKQREMYVNLVFENFLFVNLDYDIEYKVLTSCIISKREEIKKEFAKLLVKSDVDFINLCCGGKNDSYNDICSVKFHILIDELLKLLSARESDLHVDWDKCISNVCNYYVMR